MIILLAGSTETARAMIVDTFLGEHKDWKHLPMEDIEETMSEEDEMGFERSFMTMVACECAKEAQREEGCHLIITCPTNEAISAVFGEFEEPIDTVFLGSSEDADGFDFVIDTKKSVADSCSILNEIAQGAPA